MIQFQVSHRWWKRILARFVCARLCLLLAAILMVAAIVLAYREYKISNVPVVSDAFDVSSPGTIAIEPNQNALADYQESYRLLVTMSMPDRNEIDKALRGEWVAASVKVRNWVELNEAAIERWRIGTEKAHHLRIQPAELSKGNSLEPVSEVLTIVDLARLAALRAESTGQVDEAWRWHRALYRFSRHCGMFGTTIDRTTGIAIHSYAVERIVHWAAGTSLTVTDLANALICVRTDYEMTAKASTTIRADYFSTLYDLDHLNRYREAYWEVAETFGLVDNEFPNAAELFLVNEPELTRRLLQHQLANLLEFADAPRPPALIAGRFAYYDAVPSDCSTWMSPDGFRKAASQSLLAEHLLLKSGGSRGWRSREQARQRMLEVVLAAECWRRRYGELPATLEELTKAELLQEIPIDPTSASGIPIGYERNATDPQRGKVWSAGYDGVNDGGDLEHVPGMRTPDLGFAIGPGRRHCAH